MFMNVMNLTHLQYNQEFKIYMRLF